MLLTNRLIDQEDERGRDEPEGSRRRVPAEVMRRLQWLPFGQRKGAVSTFKVLPAAV